MIACGMWHKAACRYLGQNLFAGADGLAAVGDGRHGGGPSERGGTSLPFSAGGDFFEAGCSSFDRRHTAAQSLLPAGEQRAKVDDEDAEGERGGGSAERR